MPAAAEVDYSASAETALQAAAQGLPLKVVVYMNANGGLIDCSAGYQIGCRTKRLFHRSNFDRRQPGLCGV
jgi:hypothetical protein